LISAAPRREVQANKAKEAMGEANSKRKEREYHQCTAREKKEMTGRGCVELSAISRLLTNEGKIQ